MPQHYAYSELLIVAAALYCVLQLARGGYGFASMGVALFGLAAAVGTWRIGTGQIDAFADLHRNVSQRGGLAGMALITIELARKHWPVNQRRRRSFYAFMAVPLSLIAVLVLPQLTNPLFMVWAICAVLAAFSLPGFNPRRRLFSGLGMALILFGFIFVRQSPALGPDLSWHLFHVLVAAWLVIVMRVVSKHEPEG